MEKQINLTNEERINILLAIGYAIEDTGDTIDFTNIINKLRD